MRSPRPDPTSSVVAMPALLTRMSTPPTSSRTSAAWSTRPEACGWSAAGPLGGLHLLLPFPRHEIDDPLRHRHEAGPLVSES
jgi:hypothetical protein